jgi:hypothetical protein
MQIRVMPDYDCAPLWWDQADHVGDIQPEELGLSNDLCTDLWAWAAAYDATLVRSDPIKSGFVSPAAERAFEEQGRSLSNRVAGELGPEARVRYWRDG